MVRSVPAGAKHAIRPEPQEGEQRLACELTWDSSGPGKNPGPLPKAPEEGEGEGKLPSPQGPVKEWGGAAWPQGASHHQAPAHPGTLS